MGGSRLPLPRDGETLVQERLWPPPWGSGATVQSLCLCLNAEKRLQTAIESAIEVSSSDFEDMRQ